MSAHELAAHRPAGIEWCVYVEVEASGICLDPSGNSGRVGGWNYAGLEEGCTAAYHRYEGWADSNPGIDSHRSVKTGSLLVNVRQYDLARAEGADCPVKSPAIVGRVKRDDRTSNGILIGVRHRGYFVGRQELGGENDSVCSGWPRHP